MKRRRRFGLHDQITHPKRCRAALATALHILSPAKRALGFCSVDDPGVSLRFTPGFMLSPAPQANPIAAAQFQL
ncbi:MAG TPA: hypothetical protein VF955_06830, partial [Pyrinomonadaceae bacterium]